MKCERTHERYRADGSVERWTTVEDMPGDDDPQCPTCGEYVTERCGAIKCPAEHDKLNR